MLTNGLNLMEASILTVPLRCAMYKNQAARRPLNAINDQNLREEEREREKEKGGEREN